MVVGEPGIGKTALCEQLATYVALRGGKALVGHCYEEGSLSLPYLAFVEAMRPTSERASRTACGRTSAPAPPTWRASSRRCATLPASSCARPATREDDRWRLLQAVTSFLRNALERAAAAASCSKTCTGPTAARSTCCCTSPATSQGARLLIVGTYRDVEVDRAHPLSAHAGRAAPRRQLSAHLACAA